MKLVIQLIKINFKWLKCKKCDLLSIIIDYYLINWLFHWFKLTKSD